MLRRIVIIAILTGIFCSGFAVAIDLLTDMLDRTNLIVASFSSGVFGSLFAQTVLGRWRDKRSLSARESSK